MLYLETLVVLTFYTNAVTSLLSPKTRSKSFKDLPEISEGEPCSPGQVYRNQCNKCFCTNNERLMCTKMLCLENVWPEKDKRRHLSSNVRTAKIGSRYPELPRGDCKPGYIYSKDCQKCFCKDDKKAVCTEFPDACENTNRTDWVASFEDVRPLLSISEVAKLPSLQSRQVECQIGKTYSVMCNACVCLKSGNLICDSLLCVSYDDMHRMDAQEMSGKPCQASNFVKTTKDCVKCACVDGRTACDAVTACLSNYFKEKQTQEDREKLIFEIYSDGCVPGFLYKSDCNNCYCQKEGFLRCTRKTCLNYRQMQDLEKEHQELVEQGL